MPKFEFAKKPLELEFPTVKFRVMVDGVKVRECKDIAGWLIGEGKRLQVLSEEKTMSNDEADRIIADTAEKLCAKIDRLIAPGASKQIFAGRSMYHCIKLLKYKLWLYIYYHIQRFFSRDMRNKKSYFNKI